MVRRKFMFCSFSWHRSCVHWVAHAVQGRQANWRADSAVDGSRELREMRIASTAHCAEDPCTWQHKRRKQSPPALPRYGFVRRTCAACACGRARARARMLRVLNTRDGSFGRITSFSVAIVQGESWGLNCVKELKSQSRRLARCSLGP